MGFGFAERPPAFAPASVVGANGRVKAALAEIRGFPDGHRAGGTYGPRRLLNKGEVT